MAESALGLSGWSCRIHHSAQPERGVQSLISLAWPCQVAASLDHLFLNSSLFRALSLQFRYSNRLEPAAPPIQIDFEIAFLLTCFFVLFQGLFPLQHDLAQL